MNENELQVFANDDFGNVRTVIIEGKPYFVGKDIATALGYSNSSKAVSTHCKNGIKKMLEVADSRNGNVVKTQTTFIPEGDIYRLIIRSKLPSAEKFESWVMDEVLPQLRQTGSYTMAKQDSYMIEDPIERAKRWIEEQEEKKNLEKENKKLLQDTKIQQQVIGELQPKADYTDIILKSNSSMNVSQIAKDYGMSAKKLNSILHDLGVQYKSNGQWLLYSNFHDKGYTKSETGTYDNGNQTYVHTKWTQKGRLFLYELLKKNDILPIIEQ